MFKNHIGVIYVHAYAIRVRVKNHAVVLFFHEASAEIDVTVKIKELFPLLSAIVLLPTFFFRSASDKSQPKSVQRLNMYIHI